MLPTTSLRRPIAAMALAAIALAAPLAAPLAGCVSPKEVAYTVGTKSGMVCCRSMSFTVADFSSTAPSTIEGTDVAVRFLASQLEGSCTSGGEAPLVIANNTGEDVFIPVSRELEGTRIKLYPWRLHHDSARGHIRLARQIQYGDQFERGVATLRLMRLPSGREVRLTATVPGDWLCTKPTELYEGYLQAELDPAFYSQRSRGLRTSPYEQARELVSPIGMRYDVVWVTLDFLESLPVASRSESAGSDTISIQLDVREEPAAFLNAEQKVASSNIIEMVIKK